MTRLTEIFTQALDGIAVTGGGGDGTFGNITIYDEVSQLPTTASSGDIGYVSSVNGLYIWNGNLWFLILTATTQNSPPFITQGPALGYILSTDGTPTIITLIAQDPEGAAITWNATITSGTLGDTAVITQNDNVFTITPSTDTANGGEFELTFTASDGVHLVNARTYVRLRFLTIDVGIGITPLNTLLPVGYSTADNVMLGKAMSAVGGFLAVSSADRLENGTADTANNIISTYTTLNANQITPLEEISPPPGITWFGENNLAIWSDMMIVPGYYQDPTEVSANNKRTFHVYSRTSGDWVETQTIEFQSVDSVDVTAMTDNAVQPLSISASGLIMSCAAPASSLGNSAAEIRIYSRASTAATTWTLRQTLRSVFSGFTDLRFFPEAIKISTTGKHVAAYTRRNSDGGTDRGKILLLTNTNLSLNIFSWSASGSLTGPLNDLISFYVASTTMTDDIFYLNTSTATATRLECLKYISENNAWQRDAYLNAVQFPFQSTSNDSDFYATGHAQFHAYPGRSGTTQVYFVGVRQDKTTANISNLVIVRAAQFDISDPQIDRGGVNNGSVFASVSTNPGVASSHFINATTIPNNAATTLNLLQPYVAMDEFTGHFYLSTRSAYGGVPASGAVTQYTVISPTNDLRSTTGLSVILRHPNTITTSRSTTAAAVTATYTVRPGQRFLHAICIGGGGAGGSAAVQQAAGQGGGGGGGLRWITNRPVNVGDVIVITAGQGGYTRAAGTTGNGTTGAISRVTINGVVVVQATGGLGGRHTSSGTVVVPAAEGGTGTPQGSSTVGWVIGGGNGGNGSSGQTVTNGGRSGGGGGAGGYTGNGGQGGLSDGVGARATSGSGGGGGGGSSFNSGGTTGLYGIGANGGAPSGNGSYDNGLNFNLGGTTTQIGGGGYGNRNNSGSTGGPGAVRLMLGDRYIIGPTSASTSSFVRPPGYTGT